MAQRGYKPPLSSAAVPPRVAAGANNAARPQAAVTTSRPAWLEAFKLSEVIDAASAKHRAKLLDETTAIIRGYVPPMRHGGAPIPTL